MADHVHGEMDIKSQTKTFEGFMGLTTKTVLFIIGIFVFMAIFAI